MTQELAELANLVTAYGENADPDDLNTDTSAGDELSAAVGRFVAERGYSTGCTYTNLAELSLRDRLALLLSDYDANGLRPTDAALDVIMTVIESTEQTDEEWWDLGDQPSVWCYAHDAERFLSAKRREWASA